MRVEVDYERCMGTALCLEIAEGVFELDDEGYATVVDPSPAGEGAARVRRAASRCPTNAIKIVED